MASPARKGTQFRLGYALGASVPYEFWASVNHATVTPDSATIAVYAANGTTEKLASTAMTPGNPSTYTLDLSNTTTFPTGEYQLAHTFVSGGVTYSPGRRIFRVYNSVPEPMVTDEDLLQLVPDLDNYLTPGQTSWALFIEEAWNQTLHATSFFQRSDGSFLDPYEIADGTRLYHAHQYRAAMLVALSLRVQDDMRFGMMANDYQELFDAEISNLEEHRFQLWATGPSADDETYERHGIRSHVTSRASENKDQFLNRNVSPKFRMNTDW